MDTVEIINHLDEKDKKLLDFIAYELLKKEKYKNLREEIEKRREEIKKGNTLSHEEVWNV
ncbi:hypothetical protein [Nautilia sp.]